MSFSNTTETEVLNYVFRGVAPAWAADVTWYVAEYTADPGEAGTAVTSEQTYGSYARVAITRATGLSVSGNTATTTGQVQFPVSSVLGSATTHLALVTTASGAGQIIGRFTLASSLPTNVGVQHIYAAGDIDFTLD